MKYIYLLLITWVVYFPVSYAATFCVTTSAELVVAISTAESNSESDAIRIAEGSYLAPVNGFFYDGIDSPDDHITFSGGWKSNGKNPCSKSSNGSPLATKLDANFQGRVMVIRPPKHGRVEVFGLYFVRGSGATTGGGLRINSLSDSTGTVLIERNGFHSNDATSYGSALYVRGVNTITVRNNLFIRNSHDWSTSADEAVHLETNRINGIYLLNNTFYDNYTGGVSVSVDGDNGSQAMIVNNLFWGNRGATDILLTGSGIKRLHNNNFSTLSGIVDYQSDNINLPPLFHGTSLVPSINSPLISAGLRPPLDVPWYSHPGFIDLGGNPRIVNEIDIGAYESPHLMQIEIPIFIDGFEG